MSPQAPMRIALLTSSRSWRGAGASYAKITLGLRDRGHRVHLVTAIPKLAHRLVEAGFEVTPISGRHTGPREVWALRRALGALDAQAIVVDTPRDLLLAFHATLLRRTRIVYRYNLAHRSLQAMDRLYLRRVAACVYQSRYVRDRAFGHAARISRIPSYHVPNGYDTTRYAPSPDAAGDFRARYGIATTARVVLSAAELTRDKGHDIAIAALNQLRHEGLDVVYVACGQGEREGELVSIARRCGLPSVFTGLLGTRDMVAAFSAADLVVHPSLQEIFPNAVGEAMACGRPVVAADAGGTGELLGRDGTTGVLVPPGDVGALADAVGAAFAEPGRMRSLGEAARRRIEEHYPLSRMVDGYEHALAEVTATGG